PEPAFIQPVDSVTEIVEGEDVFISFDAGDPEADAKWRLFYLTASDSRTDLPDRLGEQLGIGSGNIGSFTWSTVGIQPGNYTLGLSATDSGDSVARTVSKGNEDLIITIPNSTETTPVIRIVEESTVTGPSLTFITPGSNDIELFGDEGLTIRFSASADPAGGTAEIEVFLDLDDDSANGFSQTLASGLPITATTVDFPTNLPEDTYYVGATIRQGSLAPVTKYAGGAVIVTRTPKLKVTAPNTALPIAPGEEIAVSWTTNIPASAGSVDVFARAIEEDGSLSGAEIEVLAPSSLNITAATFSRDISGVYVISVRVTMNDSSITSGDCTSGLCVQTAPKRVRVSSVPGVLWLGSIADDDRPYEGAIFEGVNYEDNAGTGFSPVGDLDGDSLDEFLICARYGKPFFLNPTGIGVGEAYVLYGGTGNGKLLGEYNLNSVGRSSSFRGVTFTGIRTPQGSSDTIGMSSVSRLPDVDGDGRDELVFGFPRTASRGHNVSPAQNGVVNPRELATLEREEQFLRGGIVIVSSRNSSLSSPSSNNAVINLDLVGQDFEETCVRPEPDDVLPEGAGEFYVDAHADTDSDDPAEWCTGTCKDRDSGGKPDSTEYIDSGFVAALARDFFSTYAYSFDVYGGVDFCTDVMEQFTDHECLFIRPHEYCTPYVSACDPYSPGLHAEAFDPEGFWDSYGFPLDTRLSGFYPQYIENPNDNANPMPNAPQEPFGARIIGVGFEDHFGTSLTLSNASGAGAGEIIVSAPERTARGILLGHWPIGCTDPPACGGEIDGLGSDINQNSGVAYLFSLRSLWTAEAAWSVPPKPHQYIVGEGSHCAGVLAELGDGTQVGLIDNIDATRIAGFSGDHIRNIVGIDDFNNDGLNDFAVGAPEANSGQGRVYVGFRRSAGLEGDFVLEKLALDPSNPERLTGVLIVADSADALGSSLATGVDFNGDGRSDLVVGSPDAAGGIGEIIVVFGDPNLRTPAGGISVASLLSTRDVAGRPRGARIAGNPRDLTGQLGFNVANAGDLDGDGTNDLLIAAPGATPRFDPNPYDSSDVLTEPGVDVDLDGCADDVSGPLGLPNGNEPCAEPDVYDRLEGAGLVYVIYGSNQLDQIQTCEDSGIVCSTAADCDTAEKELCGVGDLTINISQLGTSQLRGFMVAGRHEGDQIGGGDAGDSSQGGIDGKAGRGRSAGLASA
ncbi:MAG: integrin alpha, partial [Planctomycetes bacterium]|nr:integrin alpha [Planctomycetota bacterium]